MGLKGLKGVKGQAGSRKEKRIDRNVHDERKRFGFFHKQKKAFFTQLIFKVFTSTACLIRMTGMLLEMNTL